MSFVEESLGILHAGEDAQLKQLQRQSSELCDQMALCMDMHMQSVYAAMCQHFHPAEVVEEPTLKVEQMRQRTSQMRNDVLHRIERESAADGKFGGIAAASVRCARALQLQVELAQEALKRAQHALAQAREELEDERSRAAEFEAQRRALRRQRLHRLELLLDNTRSLKADIKHLHELRDSQKEMQAEHHRSSAGSSYSQGEEYVLLRQNQNGLHELAEKQRTLEQMLGRLEELVVAGGGLVLHPQVEEEKGKESPGHDYEATAGRIVALDERSRQIRDEKGWEDPVELAFDTKVSELQTKQESIAKEAPQIDHDNDDELMFSRSRFLFDTRQNNAPSSAMFTPSMPTELLRMEPTGKAHINANNSSPRRGKRQHGSPRAGHRAPPSTPLVTSQRQTTRTPFVYHSHIGLNSSNVITESRSREASPAHLYSLAASTPVVSSAHAPPPTTAALASMKEETHSLLRTELVRALDAAGGGLHRERKSVSNISTAEALDLQQLLRSRAKSFRPS